MSLDASMEEILRRVVREELDRRLGSPGAPAPTLEREVLTYEQAADLAACSTTTIKRWVKSGALAATGKGKLRRVRAADVRSCLAVGPINVERPTAPQASVTSILATVERRR